MDGSMRDIDATHDPQLTSWVSSANRAGCDFPIQNLPFTVFRRAGSREPLHAQFQRHEHRKRLKRCQDDLAENGGEETHGRSYSAARRTG